MKTKKIESNLVEFRTRINFVQWLASQKEKDEFAFNICELIKWISKNDIFLEAINDLEIQKTNFDNAAYDKLRVIEDKAQLLIKRIISNTSNPDNEKELNDLCIIYSSAWIFITHSDVLRDCVTEKMIQNEINKMHDEVDNFMSMRTRNYIHSIWGKWKSLKELLCVFDGENYSQYNTLQLKIIDGNYQRYISCLYAVSEFIFDYFEGIADHSFPCASSSNVWGADFMVEGTDFVFGKYGRLKTKPLTRPDLSEKNKYDVNTTHSLDLLRLFQNNMGRPLSKSEICTSLCWEPDDVDNTVPYLKEQLNRLSRKVECKASITVQMTGVRSQTVLSINVIPKTEFDKDPQS